VLVITCWKRRKPIPFRRQLENKIISRYKPICNKFDESDQDVFSTTVKTTRPEPEPEPED